MVIGGSNVGHTAVILGQTEKMYHLRLDNQIYSRAMHANVQALERSDGATVGTDRVALATPSTGGTPYNAQGRKTRKERETTMKRALEEIQRQAQIVAECADDLKKMSLDEE